MNGRGRDGRASASGGRFRGIGPGAIVAPAFVGPGTITQATVAGAGFGFALVWALVFATLAAIVLQEMSARLGAGAGRGLGEALREMLARSPWRIPATALVVAALLVGNAAYEGGNLTGARLGIEAATGGAGGAFSVIVVAALAAGLLGAGRYRVLEAALVALVATMGLAFLGAFLIARPDLGAFFAGLFPRAPEGSSLVVAALIGATIVPYNLFLHAAAAKARFGATRDLEAARVDAGLSIGVGGLISILILGTAASTLFAAGLQAEGAGDMARQLEPLLGPSARYLFGAGLFAAGLSSAITAPLATGYALAETFGWRSDAGAPAVRNVALAVLFVGAALAVAGVRPVEAILFAQVANGILLPVTAGFLIAVMNRRDLLGERTNGALANVAGAVVVLIALALGLRAVARAFGIL